METLFSYILPLYILSGLIVAGICAPIYHEEIFEEEDADDNWPTFITAVVLAFALWPYVIYRDIVLEKKIAEENNLL